MGGDSQGIRKPKNHAFVHGKPPKTNKGLSAETVKDIREAFISRRPESYEPPTDGAYEEEAFNTLMTGRRGLLSIRAEALKIKGDPLSRAMDRIREELNEKF